MINFKIATSFLAKESSDSPEVKKIKKAFIELRQAKTKATEWKMAFEEADDIMRNEGATLDQNEAETNFEIAKAIMSHIEAGTLHSRQIRKGKEIALSYAMEAVTFGVGGDDAKALADKLMVEISMDLVGGDGESGSDMIKQSLRESFEENFGLKFDGDFESVGEMRRAMEDKAREINESRLKQTAHARENSRIKKEEREMSKPEPKKTSAQLIQETSLKEIYRKLASALHPDRALNDADREHRLEKMKKANETRDLGDFASLLEMAADEGVLDSGHFGAKAPEVLKAYVEMIKTQTRKERAKVQEFSMMALMKFRMLTSDPKEIVASVKTEINHQKLMVKSLTDELAGLGDAKNARSFLKKFKRG